MHKMQHFSFLVFNFESFSLHPTIKLQRTVVMAPTSSPEYIASYCNAMSGCIGGLRNVTLLICNCQQPSSLLIIPAGSTATTHHHIFIYPYYNIYLINHLQIYTFPGSSFHCASISWSSSEEHFRDSLAVDDRDFNFNLTLYETAVILVYLDTGVSILVADN